MIRRLAHVSLAATFLLALGSLPASGQEFGLPFVTVNVAPEGTEVAAGEHIGGTEMTQTRPLEAGPAGPGAVFLSDDEYGCVWATAQASGAETWIGVARRGGPVENLGPCAAFQQKVSAAEAAGAAGLIVVNHSPGHEAGTAVGGIPALMIDIEDGQRLIDSLTPDAPDGLQVTLEFLNPETFEPPSPVLPTVVRTLGATVSGDAVEVSGRALFGGQAPVQIGSDEEGDPITPLPPETGNDLVAAFVGQPDPVGGDLEFAFGLSELPPSGGVPEFIRYFWDFGVHVGGETTLFQVEGRFTNVIGDAIGQNPQARTPAFDLEGNCTQDGAIISCEKIAELDATFDTARDQIRVTVPRSLLEDQVGGSLDGATIQEASIFQGIAVLPAVVGSVSGTGDQLFPDFVDYYDVASRQAEVGIVPAGAPAEYTQTVSANASGNFSATLDASGLAPGEYDVHVRACFGDNCGTSVITVTI